MKLILRPIALGIIVILLSTASVLAQAPAQQQQPEFVKQGQQLMREGKPEEALALYRQTLQTSPNSVPANLAAGSVLDIMGKGEEAREYFTKAIDVADTPEHKAGARRAMAMSSLSRVIAPKQSNTNSRYSSSTASRRTSFNRERLGTRRLAFASTPGIWAPRPSGTRQ